MANVTHIHQERAFDLGEASIAALGLGRTATFAAAKALLRATNAAGAAVLTVEQAAKGSGYSVGHMQRGFRALCAAGLVTREVSPGGRVGYAYTWNAERVRELAEQVRAERREMTHDNVTCGQPIPTFGGAVLTGDNLGLESVGLWKSSYVDQWDRRWAIGPDGRRVLGAVRPPWPREANWPWFVTFAGELAGETRPLVAVVDYSCEALLKATESVDPRIVEERHPLPFLKGRERVARYVARTVNARFEPRGSRRVDVEERRRPVEVGPPPLLPDFVHEFAAKLAAGGAS